MVGSLFADVTVSAAPEWVIWVVYAAGPVTRVRFFAGPFA